LLPATDTKFFLTALPTTPMVVFCRNARGSGGPASPRRRCAAALEEKAHACHQAVHRFAGLSPAKR
jgi:hypothetical protein